MRRQRGLGPVALACTALALGMGPRRADKTGSTTLELAYARQFEGGVPPAKTARFDIEVT